MCSVAPVRRSPFDFFSRSLSRRLMGLGLSIVLVFLAIALFAPLLTQMGVLDDPTELLSNTPL